MAKKKYAYKWYAEFRLAIDEALKTAPPAGSRHLRPIEKDPTCFRQCLPRSSMNLWRWTRQHRQEYLLGEKEKTKGGESEAQEAGAENHTD